LEQFGEYTDTYDWTLSMNRGLNLTDHGKIVIMQPYPSASPTTAAGQQQVNFFLGTYLLLKGGETYLNIDYGGGVQYYPQYELNLGPAVTPLKSNVSGYLWNGVYRRNFQNGFVLVNPGNTTHTLNLGGYYRLVHGTGGGTMTGGDIDGNGNYIGASLTYQHVNSVTLTGGSAAIFLNNTRSATSTTLASSLNPSVHGQSVTFTATVTPTGSGTPTGTVTFDDGGVAIGSSALEGGSATFTTSTLAVGRHSITAIYHGDTSFYGSESSSLSQTVNASASTISGFHDYNNNGRRDPGEPGLGGQTLFIDQGISKSPEHLTQEVPIMERSWDGHWTRTDSPTGSRRYPQTPPPIARPAIATTSVSPPIANRKGVKRSAWPRKFPPLNHRFRFASADTPERKTSATFSALRISSGRGVAAV
jgi:hypothetical protein